MKIKNDKGFTAIDVTIALVILASLSFVIINGMLKIAYTSRNIQKESKAMSYVIDIMEYIDRINYDEVTSENINKKIKQMENNEYEIQTVVENVYGNTYKKDIIKEVRVSVKYGLKNSEDKTEEVNISRLKIREH